MPSTPGLHHVTAIAGDPSRNAEFYVETLGLRLVKQTVNHDDKYTYHLYYGDHEGTPGTNITFFPWPQGRRGKPGAGQARGTAYRIPPGSLDYWRERLESRDVVVDRETRFGEEVLGFTDPDGNRIELAAAEGEDLTSAWSDAPVPPEHRLRGFHSVSLQVREAGPTEKVLTDIMGYTHAATEGGRRRYRSGEGGPGSIVDLVETDAAPGRVGVGSVHHVAYKSRDLDEQEEWREALMDYGLRPTGVIDRVYFRSVYVREPGGVLFEFATVGPGFTVDEDVEELGTHLVLPDWLEDERSEIEAHLPQFNQPGGRNDD